MVSAVAVLCGVSASVWAQSTVSLYGILDTGVTYTNNQSGGKNVGVQSGVSMPERWGLSGREELGDGNFALFKLENQFQTSDGNLTASNGAFSLQSYAGLGGNWGTLTFGRQYDFTGDILPAYAIAANTPAGLLAWSLPANASAGGALDNRVWGIQVNNAVKYMSPTYGGFSFGAMWGFGNVPGSVVQSSASSYLLSYDNGTFSASLVYYGQRDVVTGGNLREFAGGAAYNLGNVRLFGLVSDVRINAGSSPRATTYEAGLTWNVTPVVQLGGGLQHQTRNNGIGSASQLTLSADYIFTKRTDLYLIFALGHDKGYGAQVETALGANASGTMQNAVRIGVRHTF
ncbi:porin [Pandoraea sp. SD6-2]|nr:porin [Pandoraea sp. SD6-2]